MDFDLTTIGDVNCDWLIQVPRFPTADDEITITHMETLVGGDAANVAAAAARLGLKTALIACIGDDQEGQALLSVLRQKGIDVTAVQVVSGAKTGLVISVVRLDGERNLYSLRGANAQMNINASQAGQLARSRAVHISDPLPELIPLLLQSLSAPDIFISLDPGSITAQRGLEGLIPLLAKTNLFLANEIEYRILTGIENPERAAQQLCRYGPRIAVVKRGVDGCMVISEAELINVPGFLVDALDSTGAGDAFNAAFIAALLEEKDLRQAAIFANAVGALTSTQFGAQTAHPTCKQTLDFIQSKGIP